LAVYLYLVVLSRRKVVFVATAMICNSVVALTNKVGLFHAVAAFGFNTEPIHHVLPFRSMRFALVVVVKVDKAMGDFMYNCIA